MYFWISIVWMFRPSVCLFHYVPGFFLKYKKNVLLKFVCVSFKVNEQM